MNTIRRSTPRMIPPALSTDALYGKAAIYARRAFEAKESGEDDAYQLWATLALELLGKFALARIHPSLVVDPKNSNSMLEACGISTATAVRTIDANEVFLRLKHIVPGFNSLAYNACKDLADRRNAELHSGHAAYIGISLKEWEGKLWHAVRLILQSAGKDLEDLIGSAAAEKEELIVHLSHLKSQTALQKIEHARDTFSKDDDGKKRTSKTLEIQRLQSEDRSWWHLYRQTNQTYSQYWTRICPACACTAVLGGDKDYEELTDDQEEVTPGYEEVETIYSPAEFICDQCNLHLIGADELSAAGLSDEIVEVDEREISYEPYYGND
ncbi:hypothetical protein AO258_22580 [Pseudomonas syringae ICMP 19498]|uniref:hypothetical protein n=1 Tax=Pseudomonas syringae TaxID=317 RepID=UPI00072FB030|nr:hypothetical protein [Pseudomonas syringae]KTC54984.1 hypothetical protein AO258_22580 [Pseudomonas syringae ICMP 19498]